MANTLKFIDMVAREAQAIAHEKTAFIGTVDRQYDDSFAKAGAKIGSTLRVRKPNRYTVTEDSRVMEVQDQDEETQNVTISKRAMVPMRFNADELTLDTDSREQIAAFSKRYIDPAMSVLMSKVESNFLTYATKATYNLAGTAGTAITSLAVPGAARAKLNQNLAPKGDRCIQMDSVTMGGLVNGVAAYFNPSGDISKQYREGLIARTAMADYYENERCYTDTYGSDVTTVTINDASFTSGEATLTIAGSTGHAVGQVITMAGCYAVHPETKVAYPNLQQFVITAVSGNDITVSPTPVTSGAKQNVSAMPANGAAVVFAGATSASYVNSLMYHKDAFQFVTADLPLLGGAENCTRKVQDGISLRVWFDGDIRNDELLMRIDLLYGMAALRPEWACRMFGAANA